MIHSGALEEVTEQWLKEHKGYYDEIEPFRNKRRGTHLKLNT
jgi:hypothetical protein